MARESHGLLASVPHQYELHYVIAPAARDYTFEVPPMHTKMTLGKIGVRVEREVPQQLELFG